VTGHQISVQPDRREYSARTRAQGWSLRKILGW
jgi:hypothetical protein